MAPSPVCSLASPNQTQQRIVGVPIAQRVCAVHNVVCKQHCKRCKLQLQCPSGQGSGHRGLGSRLTFNNPLTNPVGSPCRRSRWGGRSHGMPSRCASQCWGAPPAASDVPVPCQGHALPPPLCNVSPPLQSPRVAPSSDQFPL